MFQGENLDPETWRVKCPCKDPFPQQESGKSTQNHCRILPEDLKTVPSGFARAGKLPPTNLTKALVHEYR